MVFDKRRNSVFGTLVASRRGVCGQFTRSGQRERCVFRAISESEEAGTRRMAPKKERKEKEKARARTKNPPSGYVTVISVWPVASKNLRCLKITNIT